jgi:hypothetical protein
MCILKKTTFVEGATSLILAAASEPFIRDFQIEQDDIGDAT